MEQKNPNQASQKTQVLVIWKVLICQHSTKNQVKLEAANSLSAQGRKELLGVHTARWEGLQVRDSTPELSAAVTEVCQRPWGVGIDRVCATETLTSK